MVYLRPFFRKLTNRNNPTSAIQHSFNNNAWLSLRTTIRPIIGEQCSTRAVIVRITRGLYGRRYRTGPIGKPEIVVGRQFQIASRESVRLRERNA
jgi:hypothetical protein